MRSRSTARRATGKRCAAHRRQRARLGAPGPRADAVGLDRGAARRDARRRSVARVLVRPRLDLRPPAARPARRSSARTRRFAPPATCAARRSRSTRSSPATTTSGRTSRRSIAGCRSSSRLLGPDRSRQARSRERACARVAAYVIALLFRRPDDPELAACARRLDELIDGESRLERADDGRVHAVQLSQLDDQGRLGRSARRADRADPRRARSHAADAGVVAHASFLLAPRQRPLRRGGGGDRRGARHRGALRARRVPVRDRSRASRRRCISKGDYAAAASCCRRWSAGSRRRGGWIWAYFHHLQANLEQRLGHFGNAAQGRRAGGRPRPRNRPARRCSCRISSPVSRTAGSRRATAKAACGRWTMRSRRRPSRPQDVRAAARARARRRGDRRRRNRSARPSGSPRCSADYRARGQVMFLRNRPDLAARLANFALEHGIETEFVRMLIERNGLDAPADAAPRGRSGCASGRSADSS